MPPECSDDFYILSHLTEKIKSFWIIFRKLTKIDIYDIIFLPVTLRTFLRKEGGASDAIYYISVYHHG